MMLMFGVRRKDNCEIIAEFDDPILAQKYIQEVNQTEDVSLEIVERYAENIVEAFPDGKSYITGVQYVWKPYNV